MAFDNTVTIVGNVTRDPELRFTQGGAPVATFGLAWNQRTQNRQTNEVEEQVSFFDVTCWRQLAENVAESITKGTRVVVYGRLQQRSWETGGEKRSKVEIIADDVSPSLKFATAELRKNEFRGGEGGGGGGGGGGRAAGGGGGGAARAVPNEPVYDPDEEPF